MSSPVRLLVDDRERSKDVQGEVEAGKGCMRKKEIKPWRCAKVYFRVIPPEKRHKKRRENLERLKQWHPKEYAILPMWKQGGVTGSPQWPY